eukprot:121463_1
MEKLRSTIQSTIIESVTLLLNEQNAEKSRFNDTIALIICEYIGYTNFINYKYGYPPDGKLFDTQYSTCEPFGFISGQTVKTLDGIAVVIGVAPLPNKNPLQYELYFDLLPEYNKQKFEIAFNQRRCFPKWKKQEFIDNGFILLDGFVNIWGQNWHSFNPNQIQWWKHKQYEINNPTNMPTDINTINTNTQTETQIYKYDSSDLSLWFWICDVRRNLHIEHYGKKEISCEKYNKITSKKIDKLDIGRSFIFTNKEKQRVYLITKIEPYIGYQINVESRHCRKILKGIYLKENNNNNMDIIQDNQD